MSFFLCYIKAYNYYRHYYLQFATHNLFNLIVFKSISYNFKNIKLLLLYLTLNCLQFGLLWRNVVKQVAELSSWHWIQLNCLSILLHLIFPNLWCKFLFNTLVLGENRHQLYTICDAIWLINFMASLYLWRLLFCLLPDCCDYPPTRDIFVFVWKLHSLIPFSVRVWA